MAYQARAISPHSMDQSIKQSTMPFQARASSPVDPLIVESREIDRRRSRLEDRRARVLHAKTRLIGVDVKALDDQVREKQQIAAANVAVDRMYDAMNMAHAGQLTSLVAQKAAADSAERLALAFTHQQQAAEKRARENFEKEIARSTPHVDTTFLAFKGEDLLAAERTALQQRQQREWATQQVEAKLSAEALQRQKDAEYEQLQQMILELQRQDDLKKAQHVAKINAETAAANLELSRTKAAANRRKSEIEQQQKHSELVNTFNDRFMTEDSFDRDGNRGYCFKGFTTADRQSILDIQRQQQQDLADRRAREQEEKRQYDDQQDSFQRTLILNDIHKRQADARERQVLREERERQAREKASREQYLNAVVYTNPVKEEYFAQFGTSAR